MDQKSGIIVLDKPSGITTNKAIQELKHQLDIKKSGHAGTLDPLASGVVICLINTGTKLSDYLLTQEKEYEVTVKLYAATDSYDSDGNVTETDNNHNVIKEQLEKVVNKYNGLTYDQKPPIYSAIKVNGRKLYEYARKNQEVEIKTRKVTIESLKLSNISLDKDEFSLLCKVSKGTYIRSLIVDICHDLGTIGHVVALRRLSSGPFNIKQATKLKLASWNNLITNYEVVKENDYHTYNMNEEQYKDVILGKPLVIKDLKTNDNLFLIYQEELIAIYHLTKDNIYRSIKGGFTHQ